MSEGLVRDDLVPVSAPHALSNQKTAFLQLLDNALHGPLGDADSLSDLAQHQIGFYIDYAQDMSMVGQERPAMFRRGLRFDLGGRFGASRRFFLARLSSFGPSR